MEAEDSEKERLGNPVINGILEFQCQRDYYVCRISNMVKREKKDCRKSQTEESCSCIRLRSRFVPWIRSPPSFVCGDGCLVQPFTTAVCSLCLPVRTRTHSETDAHYPFVSTPNSLVRVERALRLGDWCLTVGFPPFLFLLLPFSAGVSDLLAYIEGIVPPPLSKEVGVECMTEVVDGLLTRCPGRSAPGDVVIVMRSIAVDEDGIMRAGMSMIINMM